MGRRLVEQPDGRLAIFSTIVGNFILINATPNEVVAFCVEEAITEARDRAQKWVEGRTPGCRLWKLEELLPGIRELHGEAEADSVVAQMTPTVSQGSTTPRCP